MTKNWWLSNDSWECHSWLTHKFENMNTHILKKSNWFVLVQINSSFCNPAKNGMRHFMKINLILNHGFVFHMRFYIYLFLECVGIEVK